MTNLNTNAFCSCCVTLLSPYQSLSHPTLSTPSLVAEDTHCKTVTLMSLSFQGVCGIFAVWDFTYKHLSDLLKKKVLIKPNQGFLYLQVVI